MKISMSLWNAMTGQKFSKLVGSHLLNKSFNIVEKESVGLYRDDRLGVLWNLSGPQTKRKREAIVKVFKEFGLRLTIQASLLIVNFFDIQLNLGTSTDKPYRKPDNNPVYLDKISNFFKTVLEQLLKSVEKRISDISSNQNVLIQSITMYRDAF